MTTRKINLQRKAQTEVIVTVLLVLIALAAVAVVSTFIIKLVKENLGGTDCFKTIDQFEVMSAENGATCYSASAGKVYVTIERKQETAFNLTGFSVNIGDERNSKAFKLTEDLPEPGEKRTFEIDVSGAGLSDIKTISVFPMLGKSKLCSEGKSETDISICAS